MSAFYPNDKIPAEYLLNEASTTPKSTMTIFARKYKNLQSHFDKKGAFNVFLCHDLFRKTSYLFDYVILILNEEKED